MPTANNHRFGVHILFFVAATPFGDHKNVDVHDQQHQKQILGHTWKVKGASLAQKPRGIADGWEQWRTSRLFKGCILGSILVILKVNRNGFGFIEFNKSYIFRWMLWGAATLQWRLRHSMCHTYIIAVILAAPGSTRLWDEPWLMINKNSWPTWGGHDKLTIGPQ